MKPRNNKGTQPEYRKREKLGKRILRRTAYLAIKTTLLLVAAAGVVVGTAAHFQRGHDPNVDAINLEISSSQFSGPVKSRLDRTLRSIEAFSRRARETVSTVSNVERGTKLTERASTEVKLHNTGNVEITYAKWECLLYDPANADRPIQTLSFQTEQQDKPLRPGEYRRFKREFTLRQQLPDSVRSRFRIVRVVYANGDTWQRPEVR